MENCFKKVFSAVAFASLVIPCLAMAQTHDHFSGSRPHVQARPGGTQWHGDIRQFHSNDIRYWRGGRWHHGEYGGRVGWWWIVGPSWYYYDAPIYPYPDPYVPYIVNGYPPRTVYYCADPAGYYPYVTYCNVKWQAVPMP